jgi:hypothetical protein
LRHSAAVGREDGFRARRDERRCSPAFVRYEKCERGSSGVLVCVEDDVDEDAGRRSDLAFGNERNVGQICCVGGPVMAKIFILINITKIMTEE